MNAPKIPHSIINIITSQRLIVLFHVYGIVKVFLQGKSSKVNFITDPELTWEMTCFLAPKIDWPSLFRKKKCFSTYNEIQNAELWSPRLKDRMDWSKENGQIWFFFSFT